jgi:hypothetical protein
MLLRGKSESVKARGLCIERISLFAGRKAGAVYRIEGTAPEAEARRGRGG